MGRDRHERYKQERIAPFVPLLKDTLDSPAWRAMSHGARSLYVALKRPYNQKKHNNGRLFVSQRDAAKEIGSHHNEVARWFRELQHYGFIVQTAAGCLGIEGKGKAPHWRLTELGYMNDAPTRDFQRWDGRKFKDQKTESRAGHGARGVPEMAHTSVLENQPVAAESVLEMAHISASDGVPEKEHILSLPSSKPLTATPQLIAAIQRRDRLRGGRR